MNLNKIEQTANLVSVNQHPKMTRCQRCNLTTPDSKKLLPNLRIFSPVFKSVGIISCFDNIAMMCQSIE